MVCSVALHALSASQHAKLNAALQWFGTVKSVHLTEMSPGNMAGDVIPKLDTLPYESSETLILLSFPHCLDANSSLPQWSRRLWGRRSRGHNDENGDVARKVWDSGWGRVTLISCQETEFAEKNYKRNNITELNGQPSSKEQSWEYWVLK